MGIWGLDSGELNFSGVKTNVVGFRFDGAATSPKWLVTFSMTTSGGFPQGAYAQLAVVETRLIDKPWDRDYANFHHTWTGGSSSVYTDLVEEVFDRTRFKVGRLITDGQSGVSGDTVKFTWSFDMTAGYGYSLVLLGGKFTGTMLKGSINVTGSTKGVLEGSSGKEVLDL
ncbi:hypothetical protein Ancab_031928 [Ancistrocladus abbreviatus]